MANNFFTGNRFSRIFQIKDTETTYLHKGEIIVVFIIGYMIALSLWLLVNLGRDYNLTLEVPIRFTGLPDELAFAEQPPENARIGVSGEGWNLWMLYRNPPEISISYDDGAVNVSEIIQGHLIGYPDITIQKVEPARVSLATVPKVNKKVPVSPDLDIRLKTQYEIMGNIRVQPDSVTVTGAKNILDTLRSWPTELLQLRDVQDRVSRTVRLAEPAQRLELDTNEVRISFDVTEFTEGEIRIYVRAENVPADHEIRFNPSVITVRYDVPIEYFSEAQEIVPYIATVNFEDILRDTTGFIEPTVRSTTDDLDLRLRSVQPRRVSYFRVISE